MKQFLLLLLPLFSISCSERSSNSFAKQTQQIFDENSLLIVLESQVIQSIKVEVEKNGYDSNIIMNVALIHKQGNEYKGLVSLNGDEQNRVPIEVTYDGTNMIWQIDGPYSYMLYSHLKKLNEDPYIKNKMEEEKIDSESQKFLQQIEK